MAALRSFSQNAQLPQAMQADSAANLIEAQLFLLRVWAQEEKILELVRLEENCANLDACLLSTLLEDVEDWLDYPKAHVRADLALLPAWEDIACAILNFTPSDLPLLIERSSREETSGIAWQPLAEILPNAAIWPEAGSLLACRASLAEFCKNTHSANPLINGLRIWLTEK